jgi:8-oxo-dGTP pyrophosphatase MutT (NUDIX family)
MLEDLDGWHLLYIRRAQSANDGHSGQVAFPGGCLESGDANLKATALREAREEIGLVAEDVDIVGRLGDFISTTNYRIAPFVGVIPWPYRLRLAPAEVARAFTIPLDWLADCENREAYEYRVASGTVSVIRYRPYDGELLWGATARITVDLMEKLGITASRVADADTGHGVGHSPHPTHARG